VLSLAVELVGWSEPLTEESMELEPEPEPEPEELDLKRLQISSVRDRVSKKC
jgi:hypothetical protein